MRTPTIQWYPGHIAKAEKQLTQNLEKVDLIIEVRDARIPIATSHPHLQKWIKGKKHLLVINRRDMISSEALGMWDNWLRSQGQCPWWCNAKAGTGVKQIQEAAIRVGYAINERRRTRGMLDRPIRALTLGFPNVGKSALINRLVKKKAVASSRKAGVTRSLQWVRLGHELDLLDAPGVLPPKLEDQYSALLLALCDDIGQAAYDIELVAIEFLKMLLKLEVVDASGVSLSCLKKRYGVDYAKTKMNPYQWLVEAAELHTSSDTRRMAQRLLDDFRKALLGLISLELP
tara:strand:- start:48008 stop:48871 length:864 start_codon:yes stop_codon:yes gene_type:complete